MLNESAVMVMEIMYLVLNESVVMVVEIMYSVSCARIAKWLECRTHDCMVAGLSPCRSSGRIKKKKKNSRVNFLFWLLFQYLFCPQVTTVAHKISWSFCQKCRGRLQLNMHTPCQCGFAWSDMLHGCMVYTERTEIAVSCALSAL